MNYEGESKNVEWLGFEHESSPVWVIVEFDHPRVVKGWLFRANELFGHVMICPEGRDSSHAMAVARASVFLRKEDAYRHALHLLNSFDSLSASVERERLFALLHATDA